MPDIEEVKESPKESKDNASFKAEDKERKDAGSGMEAFVKQLRKEHKELKDGKSSGITNVFGKQLIEDDDKPSKPKDVSAPAAKSENAEKPKESAKENKDSAEDTADGKKQDSGTARLSEQIQESSLLASSTEQNQNASNEKMQAADFRVSNKSTDSNNAGEQQSFDASDKYLPKNLDNKNRLDDTAEDDDAKPEDEQESVTDIQLISNHEKNPAQIDDLSIKDASTEQEKKSEIIDTTALPPDKMQAIENVLTELQPSEVQRLMGNVWVKMLNRVQLNDYEVEELRKQKQDDENRFISHNEKQELQNLARENKLSPTQQERLQNSDDYDEKGGFSRFPGIENAHKVENVLYRGANPGGSDDWSVPKLEEHLKQLQKAGIKTIVDFETPDDPYEKINPQIIEKKIAAEAILCAKLGLNFVSLKTPHGGDLTEQREEFASLVREAQRTGEPIYCHCREGRDRTGYMVAYAEETVFGKSAQIASSDDKRFGYNDFKQRKYPGLQVPNNKPLDET